jgi:uncharacterized protein
MAASMIGGLAFIVGIIGANARPNRVFQTLYAIGAIWLGAVTIAGFFGILLLIFAEFTGFSFQSGVWAILFGIIVLLLNIWGIYSSWVPRITSYRVTIDKEHSWHGRRIAMIWDTHYGNIYGVDTARRLVERINSLSPEIVLIPGDFFDGPPIDYLSIVKQFTNITAPRGILFSNGNHEEYRNTPQILEAMSHPVDDIVDTSETTLIQKMLHSTHTIAVLNNAKVEIDGMIFAGVTYHDTETATWLETNLNTLDLDSSKPTILLKHKPTLHDTLEKYSIDLVVSGHTHSGQMWPFSLVTYAIYGKYVYGQVVQNGLTAITTSGVGSWWPPQRIGTRSEIVVIDIE